MIALAVEANLLMQRHRKDLEDAHAALVADYEEAKEVAAGRGRSDASGGSARFGARAPVGGGGTELPRSFFEHHKKLYDEQNLIFAEHRRSLDQRRTVAVLLGL